MRVLHLHNELNLACGITKSIIYLCKNLGNDDKSYVIASNGDAEKRLLDNGINYQFFNVVFPEPIKFVILTLRIFIFCIKNSISIIHAHHRYFDLIAYIVSNALKIKAITSVQSMVFNKKKLSYKVHDLITVSKTVKNHLVNYFNISEERIQIINNFINPEEFSITIKGEELFTKLDIDYSKKVLLFYGRFSLEKGLDILLKAFQKLTLVRDDIVLLLIGNGEESDRIDEFISSNSDNVKKIGSQQNVYNYLQIADLVILPSRVDPFPFAMLETGLAKKTFVGTNVDGIGEFIENTKNGILVLPENSDDLFHKINDLLEKPDYCKELAENLNYKVLSNYTIYSSIKNYRIKYQSLLRK